MKKVIISLLLILLLSGAYAQMLNSFQLELDNYIEELKGEFGLLDNEIAEINTIYDVENQKIKIATAEVNILSAQLERLLIEKKVNLAEVEAKLREAMDWKVKMELSEIIKRVKAIELLGDEKFEKFQQFLWDKGDEYYEEDSSDGVNVDEYMSMMLDFEHKLNSDLKDQVKLRIEDIIQNLKEIIIEKIGPDEFIKIKEQWTSAYGYDEEPEPEDSETEEVEAGTTESGE